MTISFDLDDTIIPGVKRFATEPQRLLQQFFGVEKIRLGSIGLIKRLQAEQHKVYIYTTSLRSVKKIWWTFRLYGIKPDKVINQTLHQKVVLTQGRSCSKYPPAFGIDVHVDDSKGVEMEGIQNNFRTIIVTENQQIWALYIHKCITNVV